MQSRESGVTFTDIIVDLVLASPSMKALDYYAIVNRNLASLTHESCACAGAMVAETDQLIKSDVGLQGQGRGEIMLLPSPGPVSPYHITQVKCLKTLLKKQIKITHRLS